MVSPPGGAAAPRSPPAPARRPPRSPLSPAPRSWQPVGLNTCGHEFCSTCIIPSLHANAFCPAAACGARAPALGSAEDWTSPRPRLESKRNALRAWCRHSLRRGTAEEGDQPVGVGCPEPPMRFDELAAHEEACGYELLPCPHTHPLTAAHCGPPGTLFRKFELPAHLAACPLRTVTCPDCRGGVAASLLPAHRQTDCPDAAVVCGYAGCGRLLRRRNAVQHNARCLQQHLASEAAVRSALAQALQRPSEGREEELGGSLARVCSLVTAAAVRASGGGGEEEGRGETQAELDALSELISFSASAAFLEGARRLTLCGGMAAALSSLQEQCRSAPHHTGVWPPPLGTGPFADTLLLFVANLVSAVRHVMTRPDSVAVLLDLDDALIGRGVLETLRGAYDSGADFTVGTVLRLKVRLGRRLVMAPRAYGHGLRRPVPNIGKSE